MSDETTETTTTETTVEATGEQQQQTDEQRVPYDRFKQVNDQFAAARAELEELRKWREEQETAKLSEIERATRERDEAIAQAQAATERATTMERSAWVTDAARKAGFTDPSDAAAFLPLTALEDEAQVAKAVEDLAKAKPHLLSQARPQGFGSLDGRRGEQAMPIGPDGKPDPKAGLGAELMTNLLGRG